MFFITIAALGLFLANNIGSTPRLYTADNAPSMIAGDTGYKHATYELHRRMHRDLVLREPRYWNKSKTYNDIVLEANGPKEQRSLYNLEVSKQGNLGHFPPVVGVLERGKHM